MHNQPNPLITAKQDRRADALGVPRVMQPVKGPFSVSVPATPAAQQPSQAGQPTQPPALAQPAPQSQQDILITRLLALPTQIMMAQAEYDKQDFIYREQLAQITLRAFSVPLFPGKKDGEGLRCASNDTEREAAIQHLATTSAGLITSAQMREIALRSLMQVKNEFEAIKYTIQLLTSK